jgi:hypothetical protein
LKKNILLNYKQINCNNHIGLVVYLVKLYKMFNVALVSTRIQIFLLQQIRIEQNALGINKDGGKQLPHNNGKDEKAHLDGDLVVYFAIEISVKLFAEAPSMSCNIETSHLYKD